MKAIFTMIVLVSASLLSYTQVDTILYEGFDADEFAVGWLNLDEDGLTAANDMPNEWFIGYFMNGGPDSTERVALSASWMVGFQPGNRNWLVLPSFEITSSTTTLSWRSAPAVGPLYSDGYTVLVGVNEVPDPANADTLASFAQNINDVETDFSSGTMHTNYHTEAIPNTDPVQYPGLLSTHTVDLGQYVGQTLMIAFLHDSDDDNYLALDDILITEDPTASSVKEEKFQPLLLYPNPVQDNATVQFQALNGGETALIQVFDRLGKLVLTEEIELVAGIQKHQLNTSELGAGCYQIVCTSASQAWTTSFIK